MNKLILVLVLLMAGCCNLEQSGRCSDKCYKDLTPYMSGGGYIDKNGIAWQTTGEGVYVNGKSFPFKGNEDCYKPYFCKECSTTVSLNPPAIKNRCKGWEMELENSRLKQLRRGNK